MRAWAIFTACYILEAGATTSCPVPPRVRLSVRPALQQQLNNKTPTGNAVPVRRREIFDVQREINKITNDGSKLNTVLTIPSVLEKYDSNIKDVDVFGWEDMWEFYKPRVKGNRAYQDSLLEVMDNFGKKKQYMEANPHHYFPDGKHPNKVLHKDLAQYIGEHLWTL